MDPEPAPPPTASSAPDRPAEAGALADRDLLARMAAGDRGALAALHARHAGWLTARCQRRLGDAELADSAVQDAFLAAWRGAGRYRGDGDVGAWLWGIAVRRGIDHLRRRRPGPIPLPPPEVPAPSAEAVALRDRLGPDLAAALAALPPELHAVLVATAVDGLTTREAAALLGIPQGTVKTRLQRARALLQERLR